MRLGDGVFSALYTFDGELIHFVAQHNYTPEALEEARQVIDNSGTREETERQVRVVYGALLAELAARRGS